MTVPSILDILACPRCRSGLRRMAESMVCAGDGQHRYELAAGVPVMLAGRRPEVVHERALATRDGYVTFIHQILDAMPPDSVVLDLGAGNRDTPNTSIIRTDIALTPFVDVVADAHRLPFKDGSIDLVLSSAVFEHLRQPWVAAEEIVRVLKPGGHVYAECAFVFPFHGYPAMYFNASIEGMRSLFAGLSEELVAVAPWQMPSFAVEAVLGEYLRAFKPETGLERELVEALKALDRFPWKDFDGRFSQADAARIAAAVTYVGMKPLQSGQSRVPEAVLRAWETDTDLRARYPDPHKLVETIRDGKVVDSLMIWAHGIGSRSDPAIAACFDETRRFSRRL